ncbi:acetate kinase [Hyphomicrobium facile]|uniref:Acetate kinase n=2 Tax=Hyphomicrobium facile TaxID=51670 RepID=A0A1I7NU84_9HYPH|nr:acetate kinase [Hyphomicrobium facile]
MLLTFNPGSSSVKIGLFEIEDCCTRRLAKGVIDFQKRPLAFRVTEGPSTFETELGADEGADLSSVLREAFGYLAEHFDMSLVKVIGHRVVHGGDLFGGPVQLDDDAIKAIESLIPLAPLHQPQSVRLIRALRQVRPDLPQAASFDTAFHRTNSDVVRRFALPRALHDQGIKRYGFHGLSYKHIANMLGRKVPELCKGKVVAAHLGSGASLCALEDGVSRDTSMGFSTLDGIPMATRCGVLDPGVVLHLLGAFKLSLAEVEDLLYHRSGLLGVSGISADSRVLLEDGRPEAMDAINLFTFRTAGEIGRHAATLEGLDALVFTAGVGENQPSIRAAICARLAWLGVELDPVANAANEFRISSRTSRVAAFVIPADEEQVIADEALAILKES